jgi:hypothetical protein
MQFGKLVISFVLCCVLVACKSSNTQPGSTPDASAQGPSAQRGVYEQPPFVENTISGWNIRCQRDGADNSRYCNTTKDDVSIGILRKADGSTLYRLLIGSGTVYPNSGQTVRIDADMPLESGPKGFSPEESRQLIERLNSAQQIATRYRHWPSGQYIQRTTAVQGFSSVTNFMMNTLNSL